MAVEVELLYHQHLTEGDRRLLHALGSGDGRDLATVLGDPALEAALLDPDASGGGLAETSPLLTFAVAVHRTAARLAGATFVEERCSSPACSPTTSGSAPTGRNGCCGCRDRASGPTTAPPDWYLFPLRERWFGRG